MSTLREKRDAARREYEAALAAFEFNRVTFSDLMFASNVAEAAYDKWAEAEEVIA